MLCATVYVVPDTLLCVVLPPYRRGRGPAHAYARLHLVSRGHARERTLSQRRQRWATRASQPASQVHCALASGAPPPGCRPHRERRRRCVRQGGAHRGAGFDASCMRFDGTMRRVGRGAAGWEGYASSGRLCTATCEEKRCESFGSILARQYAIQSIDRTRKRRVNACVLMFRTEQSREAAPDVKQKLKRDESETCNGTLQDATLRRHPGRAGKPTHTHTHTKKLYSQHTYS
jgi:hypothetical protein